MILLIFGIIYSNLNLYYQPKRIYYHNVLLKLDLLKQLNYHYSLLDRGVDYEMQNQYPEGFFFSNLMYALTWCEYVVPLPDSSNLKKIAIEEAIHSLNKLESRYCLKSFTKNLPLEYGAFYFSWTNYLRGKILALSKSFKGKENIETVFEEKCEVLSAAISSSDNPFFESYKNQYWPADIIPGIVSLSLYNYLFGDKYTEDIKNWFKKVQNLTKLNHNLFPHSVNELGISIQNERSSSLGLILILIKEINEIELGNYYQGYIRKYLTDFMGLPMIKEFPQNKEVVEDIDSGPVICGYGSVATIIGAGVFKRYGELDFAERLNQTIECIGFPYEDSETKKYLLGKVPMADFFIAWVRSLQSIQYRSNNNNQGWRLAFHLISFFLVTTFIFLLFRLNKKGMQVHPFSFNLYNF